AIQTLDRAISIDSTNPYAFFYLGRAWMKRGNYAQATTFFQRAEIGFRTNPDWLGETLSFEGLANEQVGNIALAVTDYQKALQAEPGNLMARVGLTRLSAIQSVPSPPEYNIAPPPPENSIAAPPPAVAPPPPPPDVAPPPSAY